MTGLLMLVVVLGATTGFGLWFRAREGRIQEEPQRVRDNAPPPEAETVERPQPLGEILTASQLGANLGERATMVQFSSYFCQPCKATRLILQDVADIIPGVGHVEIDAESELDLVRTLGIRRTPTVLILDESGAIRKRAVGQPKKSELVAAVAAVV
jgi:thiol-disulfide isomerase/thioredoxin